MDYVVLADQIASWLQDKLEEAHASGFVVGLSGGIDSATTAALCRRAGTAVLALWMPCESSAEDEQFARMAAESLELDLLTVDLCPPYDALLEEVTNLVEWPVALCGSFDPGFLELPEEVLVTSMRDHQKYFCIVDVNERLIPRFITISNTPVNEPQTIIKGNVTLLK